MSRGELSGPEGATSEELEPQTAFMPESKADESGEDSSDDESKRPSGSTGSRTKTGRLVYRQPSTYHAESHDKRTRRCLAPGSDARCQPFATGVDRAP